MHTLSGESNVAFSCNLPCSYSQQNEDLLFQRGYHYERRILYRRQEKFELDLSVEINMIFGSIEKWHKISIVTNILL